VAGQVALQRLVGLAVDEADDPVVPDRLADLGRARLLDLGLRSRADPPSGVPATSPLIAPCTRAISAGSSAAGTGLFDT
jgi:hypothetical protein